MDAQDKERERLRLRIKRIVDKGRRKGLAQEEIDEEVEEVKSAFKDGGMEAVNELIAATRRQAKEESEESSAEEDTSGSEEDDEEEGEEEGGPAVGSKRSIEDAEQLALQMLAQRRRLR